MPENFIMILTKKGGTSSNIHLLAVIALILLVTRIIVQTIEKGIPQDKSFSVSWHEVPFVDADNINDYFKEEEEEEKYKTTNLDQSKKTKSVQTKSEKATKNSDKKPESDNLPKSKKSKRKFLQWKKLLPGNSQNKPIFILITSDKNYLCQEFNNTVLTNKAIVSSLNNKFFSVKLSLDKTLSESEAAIYRSSYTSTFIPTILVKDSKGGSIDRLVGSTDSIGLSAFLNKCLTKLENKRNDAKKNKLKKWDPHNFLNRDTTNQ